MDDQNKNLILATALSFIVLLVWFVLFPPPDPVQQAEVPDLPAATQADATATAPAVAGAGFPGLSLYPARWPMRGVGWRRCSWPRSQSKVSSSGIGRAMAKP